MAAIMLGLALRRSAEDAHDIACGAEDLARTRDDRCIRWQEHARRELSFVNKPLIGLAAGLVAVALANGADAGKVRHLLVWQRFLTGSGVAVLSMSLLAGMWLAMLRLHATRLTARLVRISDLGTRQGDRRGWQGLRQNIQGLGHREHWTRPHIRKATLAFTHETSTYGQPPIDPVVRALRSWTSQRSGRRSWTVVRVQLWLFMAGAIAFATIRAWNYFRPP